MSDKCDRCGVPNAGQVKSEYWRGEWADLCRECITPWEDEIDATLGLIRCHRCNGLGVLLETKVERTGREAWSERRQGFPVCPVCNGERRLLLEVVA